jgi:hypothetical protein
VDDVLVGERVMMAGHLIIIQMAVSLSKMTVVPVDEV